MSSINSREIVDEIIANKGYGDGERVVEIIEYKNIFNGGITYKLIRKSDNADWIRNNIACLSQRTIWRCDYDDRR